MKINLLSIIFLLLANCQGIRTGLNNPAAGATAGIIGKEVLDTVVDSLPKYRKVLTLPSVEICYLKSQIIVECKLISCEEDCYKQIEKGQFFELNMDSLIFMNVNSFNNVLSEIETYCLFNEKKNICDVIKETYGSIDKVFIHKEKE